MEEAAIGSSKQSTILEETVRIRPDQALLLCAARQKAKQSLLRQYLVIGVSYRHNLLCTLARSRLVRSSIPGATPSPGRR